jgi:hypothetical protein
MRVFMIMVLVATVSLFPSSRADEASDAVKKQQKTAEKTQKEAENKAKKEQEGKQSDKGEKGKAQGEHNNHNPFVYFWVHTLGGTIGNGLKTGARKIEHGFQQ